MEPAPQKIRIVIIDDQLVVREGLRMLLDNHPGIKVVAMASTRSEALEIIAREPADLIILDLDMPAYTACELLDWIRSRWQFDSVPVVALSDGIPDPQLQRLYDRGINAFFRKRMDVVETALLIRDTEFLDEVVELRRDAQPD